MTDALDQMRADWLAVARYRVLRVEGYSDTRVVAELSAGKTLDEAEALRRQLEAALRAEPGYRPVMSRPIFLLDLENAAEARKAYAALRNSALQACNIAAHGVPAPVPTPTHAESPHEAPTASYGASDRA